MFSNGDPSRAFIEVLHVFVRCLTLFTSSYMLHENLTAAGSIYKIYPCTIQNLSAADIFLFLQNFPMGISKYYMHSNFCHRDNSFISLIFHCAP